MSKLTDFVETLDHQTLVQLMEQFMAMEAASSVGGSNENQFISDFLKAHPDVFVERFSANDGLNLMLATQRRLARMWAAKYKQTEVV